MQKSKSLLRVKGGEPWLQLTELKKPAEPAQIQSPMLPSASNELLYIYVDTYQICIKCCNIIRVKHSIKGFTKKVN